ncbi:MlaD family protein [Mucilaginibacter arboris]|uniref:MCE family protein n=1 Tax=Mucilaginibacter arboris TaxID=2682090 RepID=A0A7K1SZQ3_9SPHI|nr:MlaD family protein [Mucilaginibacter arboris]MVN22783.1 MCE family protein [Mucilaginibacter arboris]
MKTSSGQKLKLGLFTFIGILILVMAIFFIGKSKSLFNTTFNVYGIFKNVNGLQVGNNVRFAGINIGVIQNIRIVSDTAVRVDLTLNKSVQKFLRKDVKAAIGSDGLMGDKLIVINPGTEATGELNNGDKVNTVNPIDVDKIIGRVTKVADNAEVLTSNLSEIVYKINHGKGSIGKLLSSDKLANDLEGTVKQAKSTLKTVKKGTEGFSENMEAAKHNFLLRGFFNKKKKEAKRKQDSIKNAKNPVQ